MDILASCCGNAQGQSDVKDQCSALYLGTQSPRALSTGLRFSQAAQSYTSTAALHSCSPEPEDQRKMKLDHFVKPEMLLYGTQLKQCREETEV